MKETLFDQIDAMITRSWNVAMHDPEEGLAISRAALQQAELHGYTEGQIWAASRSGRILSTTGQYDRSLVYYTKAAELSDRCGNAKGSAAAYIGIGIIYMQLGEYPSAQQNFIKAYQYAHGVDTDLESLALNNIGSAYIDMGEYEKAAEYLNQSLPLVRQSNYMIGLNAVLDSLAELYLKTNQLDKSLEYARESVNLARGVDPEIGDNLVTLGKIYLARGEFAEAIQAFDEAVQISEETRSHRSMIRAWIMMGVMYRLQSRLEDSLTALQRAYQLALTENTPLFQSECLFELSTSYKQAGDYFRALDCFEKYHYLKERIFNERSDMHFRTLEVLHQLESARKETEFLHQRTLELQHEIEERMKIEKDLEELASHDSLTGVFNRRQFIHLGETLLCQASVNQKPLSLILFDLDHFKKVNDTYGHIAGDTVLKNMAERIHLIVRRGDVVARLGGDEFAILLPDTGIQQAWLIAERLRVEISTSPIVNEAQPISITLSLGVAESTRGETLIDAFIARADKCLYAAKENGRNRVERNF